MNVKEKKNGKNILYAVIGILTLIISVTSATYAYYTFSDGVNGAIKGNMATVTFSLSVTKMTGDSGNNKGMIPMTNWMVENAVLNYGTSNTNKALGTSGATVGGGNGICVDDNGNVVCQIYKINISNTGSAGMLLDGYVTLTGGSGTEKDVASGARKNNATKTTMRWAQVFCTESGSSLSKCTTGFNSGVASAGSVGNLKGMVSHNYTKYPTTTAANQIPVIPNNSADTNYKLITTNSSASSVADYSSVIGTAEISGNDYNVITSNYIRISDHATNAVYTQKTDITSALVYNQLISPSGDGAKTGDSSAELKAGQTYYIVVWLSETGTNQTAGTSGNATSTSGFYTGTVTFISSQGSEVTGKFSGYTSVPTN